MKPIHAVALLVILTGTQGFAEGKEREYRGTGYLFWAPGAAVACCGSVGISGLGIGGQGLLYKGLGIGVEGGYLYLMQSFRSGVGIASVNGLFQLGRSRASRKVVPFVTAGYSLAFDSGGVVHALNFGGGMNYWFREKQALLLEARDYFSPAFPQVHLLTGRIGISFR